MRYVRHVGIIITYLFVVLLEKPVSESHILFHMQKSCKKIIFLEGFENEHKTNTHNVHMPPLY